MLHCSAFEIFPDHSHASLFPINCSAKYWNRVLCEDNQKEHITDDSMASVHFSGHGEYWINHNTLLPRQDMCPSGFHFVIDRFCMKLVLTEKVNNKYDSIELFEMDHCGSLDNKLFQKFDKQSYYSIVTLYIMIDIVDEFYAEGSDVFIRGAFFINDGYFTYFGSNSRYFWLPPPNYPTYIPCFMTREPVVAAEIHGLSWYRCVDESIIADVLVCNGKTDCKNSEDEQSCSACSFDNAFLLVCACNMFYYKCNSGQCIHYDHVCDSVADCSDADDEHFCHNIKVFPQFNGKLIKASYINDLCDPPLGDMLMCRTKLQCYNSSQICHYDHSDGMMAYCEDGSHMGWGSLCRYIECRKHYQCLESYCIPTRKVCDGVIDCPVGDDEAGCEVYRCPGHMRCHGVTYCVPPHEVCDGISHCPQQEDEKYCQMCPHGCQCKGTAMYCNNVTLLSLADPLYPPSALILYDSNMMFNTLYTHHFSKLNHMRLLEIANGSFSLHFELALGTPLCFLSVKFLYMNHQGLHTLPQYFIDGPNLIYANFSHNSIQSIYKNALSLMINIKTLCLAFNKLTTLEVLFSKDLQSLSHLYLNGNPLIYIVADFFLKNPALSVIRSDWYMVCCVAFATQDCRPKTQFMSSCSNLISSVPQIVVVIAQGIIVIICNIGALSMRCLVTHGTVTEKYLFVSLILADLLMGVYLLAIASVHLTYKSVFYQIVSEWNTSIICISIGLINFVSSEVALLILSILSFTRMISIGTFGGMAFMKSKVRIACAITWSVILVSGICYTVYIFTQNMGVHNNMCIFLLGISNRRDVTLLEYIFQTVFVSCNMVCLLAIVSSMFCIFHDVIKSYHSLLQLSLKHSKSRDFRLIRIGLRLLLLLVCNVLTWVPFLTFAIMMLCGIMVDENALQWVVLLGIPICSCTDPILYTLVSFKAHYGALYTSKGNQK